MGVLSKVALVAGVAEGRLYAPQPMTSVQYSTTGVQYSAAGYAPEAQPVYVAYPNAVPVSDGSSQGVDFLSAAAIVAGSAAVVATLAHHVQKKATAHHHASRPRKSRPSDINRKAPEYPAIPDIPWMTKIESKEEKDTVPVAALATAGKEFYDELQRQTLPVPSNPWAPLTTFEHFLEETDTSKKIAMLAAAGEFVPDMQRRTIMNLVLLGGAAVPVAWLGGGFVYFFVPPTAGGGGAGLVAKDALGDDVTVAGWTTKHPAGDRSLVQGLKGDAHYLIVENDGTIRDYALNAVCTHLGCVVPWNRAANKFMCPCHGSQYDQTGKVVRGPAPLSLALAHANFDTGKVVLSPWTETDFRTDTPPWWKA